MLLYLGLLIIMMSFVILCINTPKTMLFIVVLALLFAFDKAHARGSESISDMEKSYVVNGTMGILTMTFCDAKVAKNGLVKLADRNGLDNEKLNKAILAAWAVNSNNDYNRDDLIPGVTQLFGDAIVEFAEGLEKDKSRTCNKWIKVLRQNGIVQ